MQIVGAGRAGLGRVLLLPLRRQGKVGRGCPRFALILKTPLPNPSGPPARLACVRWRANQWFANAPPHPLPSQGRGLKLAAEACPEPAEGPLPQGHAREQELAASAAPADRKSTRLNSRH